MRGRLQRDGSLTFPKRGKPPKAQDGFDVDPKDPYRLIPVFDPCDHRTIRLAETPCGRIAGHPHCELHNKDVHPNDCDICLDIVDTKSEPTVFNVEVEDEEKEIEEQQEEDEEFDDEEEDVLEEDEE